MNIGLIFLLSVRKNLSYINLLEKICNSILVEFQLIVALAILLGNWQYLCKMKFYNILLQNLNNIIYFFK